MFPFLLYFPKTLGFGTRVDVLASSVFEHVAHASSCHESKRMLTVLVVIYLVSSSSLQIFHNLFLSLPATFISPTWSTHQTCIQYKRGFIKLLGYFPSSAATRKAHPYLYRTRQLSDINETRAKLKYLILAKHTSMLIRFLAPGQQSFSFSL